MPFYGRYSLQFVYFIILWVIAVAAYDPDILSEYYWGSHELRTQQFTCDDEAFQIICLKKCGKTYTCEKNQCKCTDEEDKYQQKKSISRTQYYPESYYYPFEDNKYLIPDSNELRDDVLPHALRTSEEIEEPEDKVAERPALRHHIAHFCPTLDEARKCIRKCMKLGKPAFCGKDHVCYCGHKYSSHNEDKPIVLDNMYAEFSDLYEKYFGPKNSLRKHIK